MEASMSNLAKLADALQELRALDPEMGTHTVMVFLTVAQAMPDGITQHEVGLKLGLSTVTTPKSSRRRADSNVVTC